MIHGYGEHAGRYEELAGVLTGHGAAVCTPTTPATPVGRVSGC